MSVASRRAREKKERREAILDAAEGVFVTRGVEAATMDDVAAAAELSKGTLYLYFKSKDDLFLAVATRGLEGVLELFTELGERDDLGAPQVVARMMRAYVEYAVEHERFFRAAMAWMASGAPADTSAPAFARHREQLRGIHAAFGRVIERGKRDGTLRADLQPVQTSMRIWASLIGVILLVLNQDVMVERLPGAVDFEALVTGHIDMVVNALRADDS